LDVVTLDLRADILIDERVEFLRRRFAAGMGIKFGGAGRHQRQQSGDEVGIYPPIEFVRIAGEAEVAHVPIAMMLHQQIEHGRVQMHVEMTVYMIQSETGFVELRELGGDLFFEQGT
jgi:hypothetical protein